MENFETLMGWVLLMAELDTFLFLSLSYNNKRISYYCSLSGTWCWGKILLTVLEMTQQSSLIAMSLLVSSNYWNSLINEISAIQANALVCIWGPSNSGILRYLIFMLKSGASAFQVRPLPLTQQLCHWLLHDNFSWTWWLVDFHLKEWGWDLQGMENSNKSKHKDIEDSLHGSSTLEKRLDPNLTYRECLQVWWCMHLGPLYHVPKYLNTTVKILLGQ